MITHANVSMDVQSQTLRDALRTFHDAVHSAHLGTPLGLSSNPLICKWAYRLVALYDRRPHKQLQELDKFVTRLRYLTAGEVRA